MAEGGGNGPPGAFNLYPDVYAQRVINYQRLIANSAPMYTGMRSGITFQDWEDTMQLLFQSLNFPEDCRRPVAEYFLAGPALHYWTHIRDNYGPNPSLHNFNVCLTQHFANVTEYQSWTQYSSTFRQELGEGIVQFGIRFEDDLVLTCPHPITDLLMMQLYIDRIRPEYRLPQPEEPYGTFEVMRAAYDMIDDEAVLPYAPAPQAAPVPVPPPAEAPVVPGTPIPAASPALVLESSSEDTDPSDPSEFGEGHYYEDSEPSQDSTDYYYGGLGEGGVVVDWDPPADPAFGDQGDNPAPMGPIIALDPEDMDMEIDDGGAIDDYFADLDPL